MNINLPSHKMKVHIKNFSSNSNLIYHLEERRQDSFPNHSTNNSNQGSPESIFESSAKKPNKMETINEDIFESQHNSSAKKTRNNEDLEIIKNPRLANKKSFSDFN